MTRVRQEAAASLLPTPDVQPAETDAAERQHAAVQVVVEGKEAGVVAFFGRIEQDRPLARFVRWRIARTSRGSVRFEGALVAAWGPG